MKNELSFPLIAIICNCCNKHEYNFLYTPEELKERETELATQCMENSKWIKSTLSSFHVIIMGYRLDNRKMLYDFLKGRYNNKQDDLSWDFENCTFDLYNNQNKNDTMGKALEEFVSRMDIVKMLTISTAHITKRTTGLLNNAEWCNRNCLMVCKKHEYGWFIYVPDDTSYLYGIPNDLKSCMQFAMENQIQWLCLDSDGPVMEYDGLDIFK